MGFSADERQIILLNFSIAMVPAEANPQWSPAKFFEAVKMIYDAGQASMIVGDKVEEEEDGDGAEAEEGHREVAGFVETPFRFL